MDFLGSQDKARRNTRILVSLYALVIVLIVISVYAAITFVFGHSTYSILTSVRVEQGVSSLVNWWDPHRALMVTVGCVGVIAGGSIFKALQLRGGGAVVARSLGGTPVVTNTLEPQEKVLLNVVEEMAIAAGTIVPRVYVLKDEDGINAFVAGTSPETTVVCATQGLIDNLSRDELQGVIAHEFSHIINGDCRLNIRLIALLHGILSLSILGRELLYSGRSMPALRNRDRGETSGLFLIGLLLLLIGGIGQFFAHLLKSAVSREREYLADAAAVQFTRYPQGIGGALLKILKRRRGSVLLSPRAEEASHLFFANGIKSLGFSLFSTHPPVKKRIEQINKNLLHFAREPELANDASAIDPQTSGFANTNQFNNTLYGTLPPALLDAIHDPKQCMAITGALMLVRENVPETGQQYVTRQLVEARLATEAQMLEALNLVTSAPATHALPILELCAPSLLSLPPHEQASFLETVEEIIRLDGRVSVFEVCVFTVVSAILHKNQSKTLMQRKAAEQTILRFVTLHSNVEINLEGIPAPAWVTPTLAARALMQMREASVTAKARLVGEIEQILGKDGNIDESEENLKKAIFLALAWIPGT